MKRKSYLKKEDPVSKKGCIKIIKTSTFWKVLLHIKKEKVKSKRYMIVV